MVEKKQPFYKQNFKFVSRHQGKNAVSSVIRNPNLKNEENQKFFASCTPQVILTAGVPYTGDTSSEPNRFYNDASSSHYDYPGLDWLEQGPEVVHQITTTSTCDLRIHIDPDPNSYPDLDLILIDGSGGSCDTANWFLAGDHTIIYPDAPAGTYYIIVDGYTKEDAGPYTLYAACAKDLLIIDADGSGTSGPTLCGTSYCTDVWANSTYGSNYFYKAAIDGMPSPPVYTRWDKTANGGKLPPENQIYNAKWILWFSGRAWGDSDPATPPKILTSDDEEVLKKYLNLGGRVAMIGQDILWDYTAGVDGRLSDGSILNDYFQINEVYNDIWSSSEAFIYSTCNSTYASIPIWGVPGNPLGDNFACDTYLYLFCAFTSGAPFNSYIDSIYSRYGEPAFDTYYKSTNDKTTLPAGIRYSAFLGTVDWFKTAFFAFCPETNYRTGDTTTVITKLRALLTRIFTWFEEDDTTLRGWGLDAYADFDDTTTGNGNGIPDPGETFNLKFGVQNNSGSPVALKAYEGFEDWYTDLPTPWCNDLGIIQPGSYSEVTFQMTLDANTPIGYRFTPLINVSSYINEKFEAADGFDFDGWIHYPINGTTDWVWTTAQSQSPTHSWFAADVGSVSDKAIESPIIYVNNLTTLSFYHRYAFEGSALNCYDGGTIEYSTEPNFNNWTVIPDSWFVQNGFNGTAVSTYGNPIGGKRAYCGSLTTWTQVIINLSTLAGKEVVIRWHEGDDNSTGSTGWYIDTVSISETYNQTAGFGVFVGQPDVLLVKDEYWLPNTTAVDMYEQKIKSIYNPTKGRNYTAAVWDTSMFAAPTYETYGLPNDWMKNYQFVIWFTGFDFAYTLLPDPWEQYLGINPEDELSYFLQNKYTDTGDAARLILSSQDYFFEKYDGRNTQLGQNDFGRAYLSVDYVTQDYVKDASEMVKGRDGVYASEKMVMGLNNGPPTGVFKNYADMIYADFSQDGTQLIFSYATPTAFSSTGNLKKDRGSKFIFMPFAFENLQDGPPDGFPSKKRFLEKAMCQMLMTSSSQYPPCGYYPPAPMPDVTIYGYKVEGEIANFYWDPVQFTNCAGEPISGRYRIFGALNNPNRSSFSLIDTTPTSYYTNSTTVPAGSCLYLELRDYVDVFDRPSAACP
ncbi:MAG: hypothetical protein WHV67_03265 [Thermoanaerobaculia bacterium]